LFIATKSENHYISIEKYVGQLPKVEASTILDMEFVVMDALRFHLAVHAPYIALHGIFLDAQVCFLLLLAGLTIAVRQGCDASAIRVRKGD
jgi:cyclin H